jgi:hypothetical protein
VIKDINELLDHIPVWKKLRGLPPRVEELERRIAQLEEKLNGTYPAEVCRKCGARSLRLNATFGPDAKGLMRETWVCQGQDCNFHEERAIKPRCAERSLL